VKSTSVLSSNPHIEISSIEMFHQMACIFHLPPVYYAACIPHHPLYTSNEV
jgi:hypothetical protein